MKKECAYNVIGGADETFRFAVLRRSVRAGEAVGDAIGGEEVAEGGVDELPTIIALHAFDDRMKLGVNVCEETKQNRGDFGFVAIWERPRVVGVIIKYNQIVLKTRKTYNRRSPQITMNQIKRRRRFAKGGRKQKPWWPT